jgi:CheY-like chemotaxis protein
VATKPLQTREELDRVIRSIRRVMDDRRRRVLVVEPDTGRRDTVLALVRRPDTEVVTAGTETEAVAALETEPVDCIIVSPDLPEFGSVEFAERLAAHTAATSLPVFVYGTRAFSEEQTMVVKRLAQHAVVKEVFSPDRLLDQVTLFLHQRIDDLSEVQRQTIRDLHRGDKSLAGRKVLIVDDDIRNIFALTSILEQHQMVTLAAETGRAAIKTLETTAGIEVVLMDVMMPEMDGLDTTRAIRQNPRFSGLPIVAVTAKAMKGDREKCIEAGAWDYLSTPVDPEELLAMLRAWLVR